MRIRFWPLLAVYGALIISTPAQIPTLINFQGRLLDDTNLVNSVVGMTLRLYNVPSGGSSIYEDSNNVTVADGIYSTFLGDQTNSGNFAQALTNAGVWIEVAVNGTTLAPRERLAAVAYAILAGGVRTGGISAAMLAAGSVTAPALADGTALAELADNDGPGSGLDADLLDGLSSTAFATGSPVYTETDTTAWRMTGNAGTTPGTHFVGTSDNQPLELRVNNARAWRIAESGGIPMLAGGHASNSISAGAGGAVIAGGGAASEPNQVSAAHSAIGGGAANVVVDRWSVVAGGRSNLIATIDFPSSRDYATIGGGFRNTIGNYASAGHLGAIGGGGHNTVWGDRAVIGGGFSNTAGGVGAAVGGGEANSASGDYAATGGGLSNTAAGASSTVGGGLRNRAAADYATVGGGHFNAAASHATVGGGFSNQAESTYVTIAGGRENVADGFSSTIGGGEYNTITMGQRSTIGGGAYNEIQDGSGYSVIAGGANNVIASNASDAAIGGGQDNRVAADWTVIPGGSMNRVLAPQGVIGGGWANQIGTNGDDSVIGGGYQNSVSNKFSTVPGGYRNYAGASNTFAAGSQARAVHSGAFVWSDNRGTSFASVTNDEFAIGATNGLRIADNLDTNVLDRIGRRYRDNSIYAWAVIAGNGTIRESFGVANVTNVSTGVYNIVFHAAAVNGTHVCAIATPEIDAAPTSAGMLRMATVNLVTGSNRFVQVFINNGSGALTNEDFNLIVTGR